MQLYLQKETKVKEIGRTPKGNCIVEMTGDEIAVLNSLAQAVEGVTIWEARDRLEYRVRETDLSTVLGCVEEFAATKMMVNELQKELDRIHAVMECKDG
jgi:hypothetical protein